ncbi:low-density lipoprotein receptor-related protein 3 [Narcine bancroftii]|uniref:low-density lipoprotein receptor-related protein 3 n=1 Tax=Narcine bancroftii TaxID=1343680 RepID=UPI003831BE0F
MTAPERWTSAQFLGIGLVLGTAGSFFLGGAECSGMAACHGKLEPHKDQRGVIYSPSWPSNYPSSTNCSWYIQGNYGDLITISFQNFDLENSHKCTVDWLMIGPAADREEHRMCGSYIPQPFISTRDHAWIFFHSDRSSSGLSRGFRLSYIRGRLGRDRCAADEFLCRNGKCIVGAWRCNQMDECGDNSDEDKCPLSTTVLAPSSCPAGMLRCRGQQKLRCLPIGLQCDSSRDCDRGTGEERCPDISCGKKLGNFYGSFASPDFGRRRRDRAAMDCTWLVDTQDSRHVVLQLALQLAYSDWVRVYDGAGADPSKLLGSATFRNNRRPLMMESSGGQLTVSYHTEAGSVGRGFNATYQVKGYCLPQEHPCGNEGGCYADSERCDGWWQCPDGKDEEGCGRCQKDEYPCDGSSGMCYPLNGRCNNRKNCPSGSDEYNCFSCQPGNFHCDTKTCVFEEWRCDGQEDCPDGSDEHQCLVAVPRKVITAALIGSLVCGLLLVIALGCAFKLYSLRSREYRAFDTPMTRLEADFVQREAPPSYGQLIAQGLIPPVDDFPVYNPAQASMLQNLRSAVRRQIRRHSMRRVTAGGRLARVWSRFFRRPRSWGLIPLLTPSSAASSSRPGADRVPSCRVEASSWSRRRAGAEAESDSETESQGATGISSPARTQENLGPKSSSSPGAAGLTEYLPPHLHSSSSEESYSGDLDFSLEQHLADVGSHDTVYGNLEQGSGNQQRLSVRPGRATVLSLASVRLTVLEVCYTPQSHCQCDPGQLSSVPAPPMHRSPDCVAERPPSHHKPTSETPIPEPTFHNPFRAPNTPGQDH